MKFGQLIEYNMKNFFLGNHTPNMEHISGSGLSKHTEIKLQNASFYLF